MEREGLTGPGRVRRAGERLFGSPYVDLNRDYRRTISLAGSGWSGTTWLSKIINYRYEYRYVFLWCVENYVPLRQLEPESIRVSFYELRCTQPEDEVRRLFTFLGKNFDNEVCAAA